MRYIAEFEHIFFDRYDLSENEKEKYAIYLIEKAFSELGIPFARKGLVFALDDEVLPLYSAIEKLKNVLKREFFIFLETETEEKNVQKGEMEKFVAKMYLYEDFTPQTVMEKFNISRKKLDRYFMSKFSVPVKEYIRDLRVRNAIRHIQNGESMELVAFLSGFGSVKTMTRAFKASCNQTPGQFRVHLTEKI